VVLFDEIEKAHPDVFNVLLQILDDGRVTDSQGRVVNFKNTIIIMTSNIGSHLIADVNGDDGYERIKNTIHNELRKHFRPEFLNRVDELVIFHPLGKGHIRGIVDIQLQRFRERLEAIGVGFHADENAMDLLAEKGYDPVYGARPLKRVIQRELETPISRMLIGGEVAEGKSVGITADGEKLRFIVR
jgi:ATP-dependent Clp protease ATP-binding subunit ClpB